MGEKTDRVSANSDKTTPSSDRIVAEGATQAFMNEVWDVQAKLGIGPRATLRLGDLTAASGPKPSESRGLRPFEAVPGQSGPAGSPLDSIMKSLPAPPTRIKTADLTMDIYPTVDPGKRQVEIKAQGTF